MLERIKPVVRNHRGAQYEVDFESNLRRFGAPVILRRQVISKRCDCWQRLNKKADLDCAFCMGTGHPIQEWVEYAFAEPASNVQAASMLHVRQDQGPVYVPFTRYLFRSGAAPHLEDEVIEIDYTDDSMYRRVIDEFQVYGQSRFLEGIFSDAASAAPALVRGTVNVINHLTPRTVGHNIVYWETHTKLKSLA